MDIPVYLDLENDYLPSHNNNNKMACYPLLPQDTRTGKTKFFDVHINLYQSSS